MTEPSNEKPVSLPGDPQDQSKAASAASPPAAEAAAAPPAAEAAAAPPAAEAAAVPPAAEAAAVPPAAEAAAAPPAAERPANGNGKAVLESVAGGRLIDLRSLLEAGVHFGHQTRRWNPKMRQYIYGARAGIHIIDLDQTVKLFGRAYDFVAATVARGGNVLFVGTKRQAQEVVVESATRSQMYHVTNRWLGGTMTNFRTIKQGLERLKALERMRDEGVYQQLPKKEVVRLERERERLEKFLGGLKGMGALPAVMFVIDPRQESIAVAEARKLKIPVVALTDTNCDPDLVDHVIPGNDDAIRAIGVITARIADACVEGLTRRKAEAPVRETTTRGPGADVTVARYRGGAR